MLLLRCLGEGVRESAAASDPGAAPSQVVACCPAAAASTTVSCASLAVTPLGSRALPPPLSSAPPVARCDDEGAPLAPHGSPAPPAPAPAPAPAAAAAAARAARCFFLASRRCCLRRRGDTQPSPPLSSSDGAARRPLPVLLPVALRICATAMPPPLLWPSESDVRETALSRAGAATALMPSLPDDADALVLLLSPCWRGGLLITTTQAPRRETPRGAQGISGRVKIGVYLTFIATPRHKSIKAGGCWIWRRPREENWPNVDVCRVALCGTCATRTADPLLHVAPCATHALPPPWLCLLRAAASR